MLKANIILDRDFVIGDIDSRLFGGFAEHLGRCVYGGLYDPGHPTADEDGFRRDVLDLMRELGVSVVRYPGGNFVSGYNWEDGMGPKDQRPRRLELAWQSVETNQFGINEFVAWCRKAAVAPMVAVNLGTRGPEEARNLVEYCNFPSGTRWSDLRAQHGFRQPHGIKLWCLGNELYGDWQIGRKTAHEYGRIACETAKVMRWTDPSLELVACGSAAGGWDAEVLEHTYDHVDYLAIHAYYGNVDADTPTFLARSDEMGAMIEEAVHTCDHVRACRKSAKRLMLAFDEWNVWNMRRWSGVPAEPWTVAPHLLEQVYTLEDALLVGGMLITLINHADRVKIGCLAQVVNVIAPVMAEKGGAAWRQTIFYPFAQVANQVRGTALRQVVTSPTYNTKDRQGVPYLTSACICDPRSGAITVLAVNRSLKDKLALTVDLRAFRGMAVAGWTALAHRDLKAVNSAAQPGAVTPASRRGARLKDQALSAVLDPASWNVIRLRPFKSQP